MFSYHFCKIWTKSGSFHITFIEFGQKMEVIKSIKYFEAFELKSTQIEISFQKVMMTQLSHLTVFL